MDYTLEQTQHAVAPVIGKDGKIITPGQPALFECDYSIQVPDSPTTTVTVPMGTTRGSHKGPGPAGLTTSSIQERSAYLVSQVDFYTAKLAQWQLELDKWKQIEADALAAEEKDLAGGGDPIKDPIGTVKTP